ncbi:MULTISPECIES: MsnO8 family LLM class oxidoreductase [unclassified Devosia]|jgi:luciferase family oxidoreductase group 1|uniref:MsnO8 family LLM class oxidoreductase n=1 Tax=unclassified Devosia TaxID=196773 RepID=UPI0007144961|nr:MULTISPECIES: MsnO8 family LLM class oxidoreductase [unclassified Devosia]KQN78284.1 alkane 1-monooxygenase [Devosia sp. Leaf64]KQT44185.1 alkane 1-monooxygenase [Devosia sp. Leaf420]
MTYRLSLLDKSPIAKGETAHRALQRTIAYAQRAETLGYHRFWVAEHHNAPELASSSPEILIAALATSTKTIRVGSGGVMLQHYSPYKIAENFNLLESLAPGRIDIGIGKAPGGLPLSTKALQAGRDAAVRPDFATQLREFNAYLGEGTGDRVEGLSATPQPASTSERFLLGASVESAELAASLGWNFVFARHLNGDDVALATSISTYRDLNHRTPIVALAAIVEKDGNKARETAAGFTPFRVTIPGGQSVTVGSEAQAAEYARQAGVTDFKVEKRKANVLAGDGHDIVAALDALARQYGIEEFILDLFNPGDSRLDAIGLIADARERAAAPTALSA